MWQSIFDQIVLPEIMRLVREHFLATGEILTDEAVRAKLDADADGVIAKGLAFIVRKGQ